MSMSRYSDHGREFASHPPKARRTKPLAMATFGGLVITGMCLCILYLLESRPPTGSRTVIGKPAGPTTTASVHPAPDEASKEEQSRLMLLHPDHHVRREPKTIHLSWNITQDKRSPDGVLKSIYVINGQFPGPLIEARSGDELIVDVYNGITAEGHPGISIHWHGLSMKGANEMDGVVGLTQCAILSSEQFTYRFRIPDHQSGTFWYHAHSGVQRADGLYGGLVVHKPAHEDEAADPIMHQYEKEQLLLVGDWYHRQGNEVLEWFVDPDHYGLEPAPDSILLNGRGSFNCSMAVKARPVECKDVETPVIQITDADRVRIRVINTGVSAGFSIGLSHGTMRPITVDGGNSLNEDTPSAKTLGLIFPGERVDLIVDRAAVHTRETQNETSAKLTIELDNENMPLHNFALTRTQSFPVKWGNRDVDDKELPRRSKPGTVVAVFNLADASGQRQPTDSGVSTEPFHQAVLYSTMKIRAAKHNQPVGSINHTSWISPQPDARPLLSLEREEWAKVVPQPTDVHKFDVPWFKDTGPGKWVELAINNFDDKGHPFHLHGHEFYIVARAQASGTYRGYNPFDLKAVSEAQPLNTQTPLRKDTVYIPPMGYVVLRFPSDNEGLWLLHCHVLWHQAIGMGTVLQIGEISSEARQKSTQFCPARRRRNYEPL